MTRSVLPKVWYLKQNGWTLAKQGIFWVHKGHSSEKKRYPPEVWQFAPEKLRGPNSEVAYQPPFFKAKSNFWRATPFKQPQFWVTVRVHTTKNFSATERTSTVSHLIGLVVWWICPVKKRLYHWSQEFKVFTIPQWRSNTVVVWYLLI